MIWLTPPNLQLIDSCNEDASTLLCRIVLCMCDFFLPSVFTLTCDVVLKTCHLLRERGREREREREGRRGRGRQREREKRKRKRERENYIYHSQTQQMACLFLEQSSLPKAISSLAHWLSQCVGYVARGMCEIAVEWVDTWARRWAGNSTFLNSYQLPCSLALGVLYCVVSVVNEREGRREEGREGGREGEAIKFTIY